ncbi:Ig-like domain-containing protein [Fimbriiglobus ruber]|uniref:Alkaline phosphatase n=1 Tax=Fimbriiglobus ruber TaxID=1908690 RepID=A0A225DU58_9BACT|nr:FG-GAP repeat protein [Fimbriiglobus ruber]OWK43144.1 Alkaline phosphatase [Fimbriiglobus ruber]
MFGFPKRKTPRQPQPGYRPQLEHLETRETPALVATGDTYSAPIGQVLTVSSTQGVLANDYSTTFPGTVLTASLTTAITYVNPGAGTLPAPPTGTLTLSPDGSFTLVVPSSVPTGVTQLTFGYTVTDTQGETATGVVTINITAKPISYVVAGAESPGGPEVKVYDTGTGLQKFNFFPYEPTLTSGVRVATGDLNGDGVPDIVTIPGTGGAARLEVFDGATGAILLNTLLYDPNFRGGGYVAVGDFTGSGTNDIIVGAGEGGGGRVTVLQLDSKSAVGYDVLADFFAYDPSQTDGVRVAAGDLNGIGRDEIITAPGAGGGTNVKVFDSQTVIPEQGKVQVATAAQSFYATTASDNSSVYITAGDLSGTGKDDIITGAGSGAGLVQIFNGQTTGLISSFTVPSDNQQTLSGPSTDASVYNPTGTQLGTLLNPSQAPSSLVPGVTSTTGASSLNTTGGVHVAAVDYYGTGLANIIVGAGSGDQPYYTVYSTSGQTQLSKVQVFSTSFLGGVNVAAG